jgi:hypothetical protein
VPSPPRSTTRGSAPAAVGRPISPAFIEELPGGVSNHRRRRGAPGCRAASASGSASPARSTSERASSSSTRPPARSMGRLRGSDGGDRAARSAILTVILVAHRTFDARNFCDQIIRLTTAAVEAGSSTRLFGRQLMATALRSTPDPRGDPSTCPPWRAAGATLCEGGRWSSCRRPGCAARSGPRALARFDAPVPAAPISTCYFDLKGRPRPDALEACSAAAPHRRPAQVRVDWLQEDSAYSPRRAAGHRGYPTLVEPFALCAASPTVAKACEAYLARAGDFGLEVLEGLRRLILNGPLDFSIVTWRPEPSALLEESVRAEAAAGRGGREARFGPAPRTRGLPVSCSGCGRGGGASASP